MADSNQKCDDNHYGLLELRASTNQELLDSRTLKSEEIICSGEAMALNAFLVDVNENHELQRLPSPPRSSSLQGKVLRRGIEKNKSQMLRLSSSHKNIRRDLRKSEILNHETVVQQSKYLETGNFGVTGSDVVNRGGNTKGGTLEGDSTTKGTPNKRIKNRKRQSMSEDSHEDGLLIKQKKQQREENLGIDVNGVYFLESNVTQTPRLWFYGDDDKIYEVDLERVKQALGGDLLSMEFQSSCKGILCYECGMTTHTALLVSPLVDEVLIRPSIARPHDYFHHSFAIGVVSNTIKVLHICNVIVDGKEKSTPQVLTVGVDAAWRPLIIPQIRFSHMFPVTEGNFIYWASLDHFPHRLLAFEVNNEEFSILSCPVNPELVDLLGLVGVVERETSQDFNLTVEVEGDSGEETKQENSSSEDDKRRPSLLEQYARERNQEECSSRGDDENCLSLSDESEEEGDGDYIRDYSGEEEIDNEGDYASGRISRVGNNGDESEEEGGDYHRDYLGEEAMENDGGYSSDRNSQDGYNDDELEEPMESEDDADESDNKRDAGDFEVTDIRIFRARAYDEEGKIAHLSICGTAELVAFGKRVKINPIGEYRGCLLFQHLEDMRTLKSFNLTTQEVSDFAFPFWGVKDSEFKTCQSGRVHIPFSQRLDRLLERRF